MGALCLRLPPRLQQTDPRLPLCMRTERKFLIPVCVFGFSLFWWVVLSAASPSAAFSLPPAARPVCHSSSSSVPLPSRLHAAASAATPDPAPAAGAAQQQQAAAERLPADACIHEPMRHLPRGSRLIAGFPGPQFVSLGPSLRRNHRDQLMHRWMYTRHRECSRASRLILSSLRRRCHLLFHAAEEKTDGSPVSPAASAKQTLSSPAAAEGHLHAAAAPGASAAAASESSSPAAAAAAAADWLAAVRSAVSCCPPPEALSKLSSAALQQLHATLRELLVDALVASAPPAAVAAAACKGFSLPPASAAAAASPLPWWGSGRGLQPWRGRKVACAQQSRLVNWASPTRRIEPVVAGLLLPQQAAAVVAAERAARDRELVEALRLFLTPAGAAAGQQQQQQQQTGAHTPQTAAAAAADSAELPWFVQAEEERLQRLLSWGLGSKNPKHTTSLAPARQRQQQQQEQQQEGEQQQRKFDSLRRALGAAIDVALLLTEVNITKKSGAAAPYSWLSPFLRSAASSKRRRRRERGRPTPELRTRSREDRRKANRDKRLAAAAAAAAARRAAASAAAAATAKE
ncbi:hypothetical protein Efla_005875 [Eimeria flavescens]